MDLFPVIVPVGKEIEDLFGEERVARLSARARDALRICAQRSGVGMGDILKDEDNVPLPWGDYRWSVSHKRRYVAAVISDDLVGIDIEEIRPRPERVLDYVAVEEEWQLVGGRSIDAFFRFWTAKEAVVKATGVGLRGLKKSRVISVPDDSHLVVSHQGRLWDVEQKRHDNHLVAVTRNGRAVHWAIG